MDMLRGRAKPRENKDEKSVPNIAGSPPNAPPFGFQTLPSSRSIPLKVMDGIELLNRVKKRKKNIPTTDMEAARDPYLTAESKKEGIFCPINRTSQDWFALISDLLQQVFAYLHDLGGQLWIKQSFRVVLTVVYDPPDEVHNCLGFV